MPEAAKRAAVGGALSFDSDQKRGIEGVPLRAIAPLARAHPLFHFGRGLFHDRRYVNWRQLAT